MKIRPEQTRRITGRVIALARADECTITLNGSRTAFNFTSLSDAV